MQTIELNNINALIKVVKGSIINKLLKITIEDKELLIESKKAIPKVKKVNQLKLTASAGFL
jgi:hypothetical protein